MAVWVKILIVALAVHYALAIFVLYLVLKDNLRVGVKPNRAKLIVWNLTVLLLAIVGPIVYLVYRAIAKPHKVAPPSSEQPTPPTHEIEPMTELIPQEQDTENKQIDINQKEER